MTGDLDSLRAEVSRLRRLTADLGVYREISQRLLSATSLEQIADIAISAVRELFGARGGALLVLAGDQPGSPPFSEYGRPAALWRQVPQEAKVGLLTAASREKRPIAAPAASQFFSQQGLPEVPAISSLLMMPMNMGPARLGALLALNLSHPESVSRYLEDAAAFAIPVCHALAHVRLLEARGHYARLLETIIENSHGLIAYLDRNFNFIAVNSAYVAGCGHSRQELIGQNHFRWFPEAGNQAIFERVRDTGEPAEYRERPFVFADQPERGVTYWNWRLAPVKSDEGKVEGLVLSLTDMTEHVRARERTLAAERARADMAETVAAEINHRMKNNLAMMAGLLEMQLTEGDGDQAASAPVRQAIARIRTIAEVHAQLYEARSDSLELRETLRRVAGNTLRAVSRQDVSIQVEGDTLDCHAGAATALCAAVNELVTNSVKHGAPGPDGKLLIRLALERRDGRLALSVWNSGNPISPHGTPEGRSAMGLRLVQEIATRHYQGSFDLRPHLGGTLAQITLNESDLHAQRHLGLAGEP